MSVVSEGPGLREFWPEVLESLRKVAPVYDKLNKVISFNSDVGLRVEGISGRVGEDEVVLDAGAGNGMFTEILLKQQPGVHDVVMLDTLAEMLSNASQKVSNTKTHPVIAVFERMPFRDNMFNSVLMGFSLRDAKDMRAALSEVRRVVGVGGKLIVVDLGKPDNRLKTSAIGFYWRFIAPLLAFFRIGLAGLSVYSIYKTYKRLPTNSEMKNLLQSFFKDVDLQERMMGGALIVFSRGVLKANSGELAGS